MLCICSDFLFLGQFIFPFTPSTCISPKKICLLIFPIFPNTRKTFKELKKIPKMYVYVLVGYGPMVLLSMGTCSLVSVLECHLCSSGGALRGT